MRNLLIAALGFVTCFVIAASSACNVGPKEGDSCNGLVEEDECIESTTCQTIGSCSQTYCCPADPSTSTDPHCNGALCPPVVWTPARATTTLPPTAAERGRQRRWDAAPSWPARSFFRPQPLPMDVPTDGQREVAPRSPRSARPIWSSTKTGCSSS